MQTNFNSISNISPAFGAVNLKSNSEKILRAKLKNDGWSNFLERANKYTKKHDEVPVDIIEIDFADRYDNPKKLWAKIINTRSGEHTEVHQRLFERTKSFVNRCFKRADELEK